MQLDRVLFLGDDGSPPHSASLETSPIPNGALAVTLVLRRSVVYSPPTSHDVFDHASVEQTAIRIASASLLAPLGWRVCFRAGKFKAQPRGGPEMGDIDGLDR